LKLSGSTVGESVTNLRFYGAEIQYTVTKPLP
jgi:hypothetical protein